jgi:exodeoxyribonuclease VII small subunit
MAKPTADTEISFEAAIATVEQIAAEMENGQLPLQTMIDRYERGTHLIETCRQRIDEARQRIETLIKRPDGSVALQSAEADRTSSPPSHSSRPKARGRAPVSDYSISQFPPSPPTADDDDDSIPF